MYLVLIEYQSIQQLNLADRKIGDFFIFIVQSLERKLQV